VLLFIFSVVLVGSYAYAQGDSVPEDCISLEQGASIRKRTGESEQGLRFRARLHPDYKEHEHGFYLVYGETTVEELKAAIAAGEEPLMLNGKEVYKVQVTGTNENDEFSIVLTGIPEKGYLEGLTAIPYVVINGVEYLPKTALTRSIAEVAVALLNAEYDDQAYTDIVNYVSSSRRLLQDRRGRLRVVGGAMEVEMEHIRSEFIRDWYQKYGADLREFTAEQLYAEALKPLTQEEIGNVIFNSTNFYGIFALEKWSWVIDLVSYLGAADEAIVAQARVISEYGGINPFGDDLNGLKNLVYTVANLFNSADEGVEEGIAIGFVDGVDYELIKLYNKTVIINPKNYQKIYRENEGIVIPAYNTELEPKGYRFTHYKIGDRDVTPGESVENLQDNDIIEPRYELRNYNIRFYDGATEIGHLRFTYNIEMRSSFPTPEKPGYNFLGWYNNPELEGEPITGLGEGNTGHLNYYAKWEQAGPSDLDRANEAKNALQINYVSGDNGSSVTNNIALPTSGLHNAVITWASDNAAITTLGVVTRAANDVTVNLTATIKVGEATVTRVYQLVVKKYDATAEYTITYNLNGGAWPVEGGSEGYTDRNKMVTDFLTDFYNFVQPAGMSLSDFMHGIGKTSGFDGLYGTYDETNIFAKLFDPNVKGVNAATGKFINQPQYNKWVPLMDLMEEYTNLGVDANGNQQSFWASKYIGARRIVPFMMQAKPAGAWNHIPMENVTAITSRIPDALKGTVAGTPVAGPTKYTPGSNDITLPAPVKDGDPFIGWYDNPAYQGEKITKILKGSTGNKVLYARYQSTEVPEPSVEYTITFNLNGGQFVGGGVVPSKYQSDSPAINLPIPARNGYEFVGWYDNAQLSGSIISAIPQGSSGNKVFYAKWAEETALTDAEKALDAKNALDINLASGDTANNVTKNVILPTSGMHGAVITWASNNAAISVAGVVTRGENDVVVTLTATIKVGTATETKTFTLTVAKLQVDPNTEYTITFNLNGGSWPSGGYANKNAMIDAFLGDLYNFVQPTESLVQFKHGSRTSGFDGLWYSNETYRGKIYGANIKTGNNNYFLSHSNYQAKWAPLANFMVNFVKKGNPDQDFWSSPYTGCLRMKQYFTNVKPGPAWSDEDMAAMPTGLKSFAAPRVYKPTDEVVLPVPSKAGDAFLGWYDNAGLWGTAITKIAKGSTGNKVFYARYNSSVQVDPSLTDEVKVAQAKANLQVGYGSGDNANSVTKNVTLPKTGLHATTITWASSDASTISTAGVVVRKQTGDVTVTLTATIKSGSVTDTKAFTLKVLKVTNYTIEYVLNGGGFAGYTNKTQMADAFMADLYAFVGPTESLAAFKHGAGKTSGYKGLWFTNEDYKAKVYAANVKSGNNNYFLSHSTYGPKWKPLADFMVNFVKTGNPDQSFWASPYTGCIRLQQYLGGVKPGSAWTDEDMAAMPSGLSATAPYEYNPNALPLTLPTATRSGYTFEGWYTNADFSGSKVTAIAAGSTGNKKYYAKWSQPTYTITLNLNGGALAKFSKSQLAEAFLNDLYSFVRPSESLAAFKHGAGKTSGYKGLWFTNEDYRAKIYAANVKSGNNEYFLSHAIYGPKWKPLADFMVNFVKKGNPDQNFWASPYTGCIRLQQYLGGVKPGSAWTDADMNATPNPINPTKYSGGSQAIILPPAARSGYTFEGWYTANTGGTKVTQIAANATGNKVFYARWKVNETPPPPPSGYVKPTIKVKYMTNSDCYRANRWITVKGVIVHTTAVPGVMAAAWFTRWNKPGVNACVHAFLDNKEIWQYLPWTMRGWHAGGSANNTHIGVEICEPAGHYYSGSTMVNYNVSKNSAYFHAVYNSMVNLTVYLLKLYGLSCTTYSVMGHSELYAKGLGSSSADPMQWFPKYGKSMNTFRADVKARM
jgi:N-acetylmuramoyl-L-alanine amidase